MRLRTRLAASHGVVIALTLLVAPLALFAVHHLAGRMETISSAHVRAIEATEMLSQALSAELRDTLSEIAHPGRDVVDSTPAARAAIEEVRTHLATDEERAALGELEQHHRAFEAARVAWRGDPSPAGIDALAGRFGELRDALIHLRLLRNSALAAAAVQTRDRANTLFALLLALSLLTLAIGLLATIRAVRAVAAPVEQLNVLVRKMSAGDFDVSYRPGTIRDFNVLGRHFESMGQALHAFRTSNMERIIAEQRRSEAVLDSIGDGLVIFAEDGRVERINPVAERQLGVEPDGAIGRRFEEFADDGAGDRVRELLRAGDEIDGSAQPEIHITRDGEHRILAYSLHRFVEGESGRPGAVMVLRDVTIEREFDKMRSEFVLRASHELRTPIASIGMGLGLLGEKFKFAPGSRDLELYETVQQELRRMVNLLTDLLDLSRLRVGEHTLERVPTDVAEVITHAAHRFVPAGENASIAIETDIKPGLPRLSLCRSAFDRVLDNLINNALRHTATGGTITLSAYRTTQHVRIAVADTGEGIASNQLAMIFQPFVQIGSKRGGAGLGLAICREIVNQHGGEITVSSQLRRGTTFTISLPA
ncbi:MAG TPA: ATP-binding protein [Rudaea sp.]